MNEINILENQLKRMRSMNKYYHLQFLKDVRFFFAISISSLIISFNNETFEIESLSDFDCSAIDLAIFSAGSSVARDHAPDFVKNGVYVIDLSSEFRYEENIPLVIPEINPQALIESDGPILIANPNCSVSQLLIAIEPIHKKFNIDILNIACLLYTSDAADEP